MRDLAHTDGWAFKNVAVANDHDPFTAGSQSLLFAKGDSEAVCLNLDHPTLRLFAADRSGNGKAQAHRAFGRVTTRTTTPRSSTT